MTARVFSWDWREQPDMEAIASFWPQTERQWQAVQAVYDARWRACELVGKWMRQANCPERCFPPEDDDAAR